MYWLPKDYKLFEFVKELDEAHPADRPFSVILTMAKSRHIPVLLITGDYDNLVARIQHMGLAADVTVLKCDATAIKTAARANPTLYLLKGGTILAKWSYADYGKAIPAVNELPGQ